MRHYLQSHTVDMPFNSDVLLKLIELCTNNCYFSCNGNFFRQKRGLPMGSCISPVLSNIYMEFFERYLLPSIVNFELVWLRYVDDVFAVLPDNIDLDNFLASLNRLSPSIKFTIEKESNNSIPFLDVEVIRGENNRPQFKIYRKPTHSNLYIHAFSGHSDKIKEAAINNIFQRAYKLCDPQFLDHEIKFIYKIFKNLGYEKYFIDKSYYKARLAYYKARNTEKRNYEKTLVLPPECEKENISKLVPSNVRLVYSTNNTTKKYLRNKETKGLRKDAGIYSIPCNSCNLQYIGESDNLARRLQQHRSDLRTSNENNAIVKHRNSAGHAISIDNFSTLYHIGNVNQRKLIESFLIKNIPNMNLYKTSITIDNFTSSIIYNNVPNLKKLVDQSIDNG